MCDDEADNALKILKNTVTYNNFNILPIPNYTNMIISNKTTTYNVTHRNNMNHTHKQNENVSNIIKQLENNKCKM